VVPLALYSIAFKSAIGHISKTLWFAADPNELWRFSTPAFILWIKRLERVPGMDTYLLPGARGEGRGRSRPASLSSLDPLSARIGVVVADNVVFAQIAAGLDLNQGER